MKNALLAALIPVQFQLGHFTGVDQFGQACSLTMTAKNGDVMDSFTLETAGFAYEVMTGSRLKTDDPSRVTIETAIALSKGNSPSRMVYVTSHAPTANKATFEIGIRGTELLSIKMKKGGIVESCSRLK